jgi:RNA polymerase sigma factor (sigma-70 family)
MSQGDPPEEEDGQDELCGAFAALGGRLTWAELTRLLGSDEYYDAVVRLVTLLLGGKTAAAERVVQASYSALQHARRPDDPEKARVRLYREVVYRSRQVQRRQVVIDRNAPLPASAASDDGHQASGGNREGRVCALRALPVRQREAVVLHAYMDLSETQVAEVMGISTGAVRSHLARGMSSIRRLPGPG